MKNILLTLALLCIAVLLLPIDLYAQPSSAQTAMADSAVIKESVNSSYEETEFNQFMISTGLSFMGTALGALILGSSLVQLFISLVFAGMRAKLVSIPHMARMYENAFQYGFKTMILIISVMAGILIGSFGLLITTRLLMIHFSIQKCLVIGSMGGLAGGILLGKLVYQIFKYSAIRFWKKYSQYRKI